MSIDSAELESLWQAAFAPVAYRTSEEDPLTSKSMRSSWEILGGTGGIGKTIYKTPGGGIFISEEGLDHKLVRLRRIEEDELSGVLSSIQNPKILEGSRRPAHSAI